MLLWAGNIATLNSASKHTRGRGGGPLLSFVRFIFTFIYVYKRERVCYMCAVSTETREGIRCSGAGVHTVVSHLIQVLKTKLSFFAGIASVLNS